MIFSYSAVATLLRSLLLCCVLSFSISAHSTVVVTVTTHSNSAIEQASSAIRIKLPQLAPSTTVIPIDALDNQAPELIVTLGSNAIEIAHERFTKVPVLSCLILDGELLNPYPNNTGIVMQQTIEQQLYWHSRILPKAKRIGILYSPEHNEKHVALIVKAAELIGVEIVTVPVQSAQDLPSALKAIKRNADSILAIPDPIVYSGKTAKGVYCFLFETKYPWPDCLKPG